MAAIKKDRIKDQMVRSAARLWQVPENEIDTAFDPLIMLMIDACAAELEKIGYDIGASQNRLLDKLAGLILPEAMLGPTPASCMVQAMPVEATAKLDALTRFFTTQRTRTQTGIQNLDVFFSPAGEFILHRAALSYFSYGSKLFKIGANGQRELISNADADGQQNIGEIWLALAPDKALQTLKGLSIYFDLRRHSEATAFYKSLATSKAFVNGADISLQRGYHNSAQFQPDLQEMLVSGDDYTQKMARHIAGTYQNHFVHIGGDVAVQQAITTDVPQALQAMLGDKMIAQLAAAPMLYIRIVPGRVFHQEVLDALFCGINTFPAINRKLNLLNYRTDPWINIVPIQVEGAFLDLHNITSITGEGYKFRISTDVHSMEGGEALVRSSGIGKADSREVREIIGSLMEAIRDESAYFSDVNNEFIQARLKEITQILARLEDQVDRSKDRQAGYQYVLLRSKTPGEQLTINFWTTNGADANNIRTGTSLTPLNHTLTGAKETVLVTNAVGGKSGLTETEKRNLLKQQLVSKGKIVSAQDVKMHCVQLFGDKLQAVDVKKGVEIGAGKNEGFARVIDVQLTLTDDARANQQEEIAYLRNELEYTLELNASPVYPFRVVIT